MLGLSGLVLLHVLMLPCVCAICTHACAGGVFKLELFLPEDYPMAPPKVGPGAVKKCTAGVAAQHNSSTGQLLPVMGA
jgi:hypothetical protein